MMRDTFTLTGRHVLAILIGFFLVIIAANAVFLNFALKTFPGEHEAKSYVQGLNYNERLAARAAQARLGWTATITTAALAGEAAEIVIALRDDDGAPLTGLTIDATLSRPASDGADASVAFSHAGRGDYRGSAPAGPGAWNLQGVAVDGAGRRFEFAARLVLE